MQSTRVHTGVLGFTLVELLVTVAVLALVFVGLFGSIQFALKLIHNSKASTSALALANEKLEYVRSMPYDSVGTVLGIPSGVIPQNATTTVNGVLFHERVVVQYVDSPDDGIGGADANGILADYKEVKVEYSWKGSNGTSTIFLLTDIVPQGIESTTGGGTLTVNVFDAMVEPVTGAAVRIYNNTTTTTIDTTRYTNSAGVAMFAGAPAAANYEIFVSKAGYSTDQTYTATTSNPTPVTSPVAVIENAVSTMNFQIDEVSDLEVRTVGQSTSGLFSDAFDDTSKVGLFTNTEVSFGEVVLSGGVGAYMSSGSIESVSTTPSVISSWSLADWNTNIPTNTGLTVHLYSVSASGIYTRIPDSELSGNSVGFVSGPIDISGISVSTYPTLALGADLSSSDVSLTPALLDWSIEYIVDEPTIGSVPFTLFGTKIIGSGPIYKYEENHTTNGSGVLEINDLEWDSYDLSLTTGVYDIANACAGLPYVLNPGVSEILTLTLVPATTNSLRVSVVDIDGNPIIGADVELSRSGFSKSGSTTNCGQTFFNSGLISALDYVVDVHASGYTDQTITDVSADGSNVLKITMSAS